MINFQLDQPSVKRELCGELRGRSQTTVCWMNLATDVAGVIEQHKNKCKQWDEKLCH